MKRYLNILFFILFVCSNPTQAKNNYSSAAQHLYFIENKGQIRDQYGAPRNDIQYTLQGQGITIFIGNGSLHYQFSKRDICSSSGNAQQYQVERDCHLPVKNKLAIPAPPEIETYRLDVELHGANKNAEVTTEDQQAYYENYYLPGCAVNGIEAHTCMKITYKNILPDIDWVIYIKGEKLEHEFVVRPGGDVSNIRLKYSGQTGLEINEDGSLTATTAMGIIKEQAPVCYLSDNRTSRVSYKLHGNVLFYKTSGYEQALTIDPALEWGTYYGPDTSSSVLNGVVSDASANIYATGVTYATTGIATTGSYQVSFAGIGDGIPYLVKFDSSGNRLWATYYGGSGAGSGVCVACDHAGNVYMGGYTTSFDSIATPGSQQPALGGPVANSPVNGFLVKFTPSGSRIWATYYGGDGQDEILSVNCDNSSNIFIAGIATSTFNIATPGSFEPVFINPGGQYTAGFLAKFDSTGVRLWGTYYKGYGGTNILDVLNVSSCTDGNNVYFSAYTGATDSISTPGCWQPQNGGSTDAFVAKFNPSGNRIWATFYGGENQELTGTITCRDGGALYLLGQTESDTGIASPVCYQPLRGGGFDAFLVKFNSTTGMREWGTYYGGPADEDVENSNISANAQNSVYITGSTASTSGITTPGAWQPAYGGGANDAFLAQYNPSGTMLWSTYYGGSGNDGANACAFDGLDVYICGVTNSINNIATAGSFDSAYDGNTLYNKAFLAKFADLLPGLINGAGNICLGHTDTLSNSVTGGTWSSGNTSIATVDPASGIVTGVSAGVVTITYFAPFGGDYVTLSDTIRLCNDKVSTVANNNRVVLFPNPATTAITITATDKINAIVICDPLGQIVYTHTYNSEQVQVDIADLPVGVYFVKINSGLQSAYTSYNSPTATKEFVKE